MKRLQTKFTAGRAEVGGIEREVLLWHDQAGQSYPLSEQLVKDMRQPLVNERQRLAAERQRAEAERQRTEAADQRAELAQYLRSQGIDPDSI